MCECMCMSVRAYMLAKAYKYKKEAGRIIAQLSINLLQSALWSHAQMGSCTFPIVLKAAISIEPQSEEPAGGACWSCLCSSSWLRCLCSFSGSGDFCASLPEKVVLWNARISFNTWAVHELWQSQNIHSETLNCQSRIQANVNKGCDCDLYIYMVAF